MKSSVVNCPNTFDQDCRSNALLTYEKPSLEQSAKVSNLLGPCTSSSVTKACGSGSTVSETLEIVNSARGMFNSGTFLNVNANNRSDKALFQMCIAFSLPRYQGASM